MNKREVLVYIGIRGPGPVVDTKPLSLNVPGNKTNEEVYDFMRSIFQDLIDEKFAEQSAYDPKFGDHRVCICSEEEHSHTYERHFDSYDNMRPVGCKYCSCTKFEEKIVDKEITNEHQSE